MKRAPAKSNNGASLGFEQKLWQAADNLRGHMDAGEYKHVVLRLIFTFPALSGQPLRQV